MTEHEQIYESYLEWKNEQIKPFLERRNDAFKKQVLARERYIGESNRLARHEANPLFVEKAKREFDKMTEKASDAQAEYLDAIDKFNLETYLKEENVGS